MSIHSLILDEDFGLGAGFTPSPLHTEAFVADLQKDGGGQILVREPCLVRSLERVLAEVSEDIIQGLKPLGLPCVRSPYEDVHPWLKPERLGLSRGEDTL
jgi:hypothetical protein